MCLAKNFLLLLSLFLYGCTVTPDRNECAQARAIARIDSSVEYVGPDNIRLLEAQYPKDVVLMFPYVSGAIFGSTSDTPIYITEVDEQLNFSLNLYEKIKEIDKVSMPLTEEWTAIGLQAEPKQTRITRIATFPYSYATQSMIGAGGFINPLSRNTMILLYVDRSCKIRGEIELDGRHYSHNLSFAGRGFHWVEIVQRSKREYILQTYFGENRVNFSIHIENALLI